MVLLNQVCAAQEITTGQVNLGNAPLVPVDGSYTCSCDKGYTINDNGYTCDGKAVPFKLF